MCHLWNLQKLGLPHVQNLCNIRSKKLFPRMTCWKPPQTSWRIAQYLASFISKMMIPKPSKTIWFLPAFSNKPVPMPNPMTSWFRAPFYTTAAAVHRHLWASLIPSAARLAGRSPTSASQNRRSHGTRSHISSAAVCFSTACCGFPCWCGETMRNLWVHKRLCKWFSGFSYIVYINVISSWFYPHWLANINKYVVIKRRTVNLAPWVGLVF